MGIAQHTIPILPAGQANGPATGCGGCLPGAGSAPVCRQAFGADCAAPEFSGPPAALARLRQALAPLLGALDTSGLVRALHVQDGEVDLQLALPAGCGAAALADQAFQTLRSLLPDTDIYVRAVG